MKRKRYWRKIHHHSKRCWHFFWKDDSAWSWIANILVAFIVIRWAVYPLLGILLGTSFPIVAVVSESMEHGLHNGRLCDSNPEEFRYSFEQYWKICGGWYETHGISQEVFQRFPFRDGFDKGDVIILWRARPDNLETGDILVFQGNRPQPIIHRIVDVKRQKGQDTQYLYQTKGDHNRDSIEGEYGETSISPERIYGKGILRVPYLGWVKIIFVELVRPFGIEIVR